jgi:hypothetical protein
MTVAALAGCETGGEIAVGERCGGSSECETNFCVVGELTNYQGTPFCSEDCTGRKTGDACGGGAGRCVDDYLHWCWLPCQSDADCIAANPDRPTCREPYGVPMKVCFGIPIKGWYHPPR